MMQIDDYCLIKWYFSHLISFLLFSSLLLSSFHSSFLFYSCLFLTFLHLPFLSSKLSFLSTFLCSLLREFCFFFRQTISLLSSQVPPILSSPPLSYPLLFTTLLNFNNSLNTLCALFSLFCHQILTSWQFQRFMSIEE